MDQILLYLLQNQNIYVSGEDIASNFSISRTAVWKHIERARKLGFEIESNNNKGYLIKKIPEDKIIPEVVEYFYQGKLPFEMIVLDSVDSTNNYAKKIVIDGRVDDFIVTADSQLNGKGRLSRKWESEQGKDLTFSLNLLLNRTINEFYQYTITAALSVFEVLSDILRSNPIDIRIKWPNDIYVNRKKICGILSEMITEGLLIKNIVIGIGVNINSNPALTSAISIKNILNTGTDKNLIFSLIIKKLYENLLFVKNNDFNNVFLRWKTNLGWLGEEIKLDLGDEIITGILKDINSDGAVIISNNGFDRVFYTGDLIT